MILCYHKVSPERKTPWWVSVDKFYSDMIALRSRKVVSLDDYDPLNPDHVVITFDGVYKNIAQYAAPILQEFRYPFELFVIGDYIGRDNEFDVSEPLTPFASIEYLKRMEAMGGKVQWHTRTHALLTQQDPALSAGELEIPEPIRRCFPLPHFNWFAYPHALSSKGSRALVRTKFKGAIACENGDPSDQWNLPRKLVFEGTSVRNKKISIIIPNFNYGHLVHEAIDSALGQTYPADEILVIDDCSTDNSRERISTFRNRVRVEFNERNLGIIDNFNKAVSLATGDFIVFLGADNRMRADYLEKTVPILLAQEEVGVVYTDMMLFGDRSHLLAEKVGAQQVTHENWIWQFPEYNAEALSKLENVNFIHGSSIFRRKAYDAVGGYRKSGRPEDHDFFHRILMHGWKAARSPHALIEYRQHSENQANTKLSNEMEIALLKRELAFALEGTKSSNIVQLGTKIERFSQKIPYLNRSLNFLSGTILKSLGVLKTIVRTMKLMRPRRS